MFSLLLSLLTRFSFAQVIAATAVTVGATVTIAGSADVVATFERVAAAAAAGEGGAATPSAGGRGADPALAVLTSPVQFDGDYVLKNVTYRLEPGAPNIAAIVFRMEAPAVKPASITVQAASPSGAYYRCGMEPAEADLLVTCETKSPALPVAKANRLYVEIQS